MASLSDAHTMWQHSVEINADEATATGCFTTLPLRIHRRNDLADQATMESIHDWGIHIGDGWEKYSGSCCSPVGNWGAFIFPESLQERLGVITYLANIGNIHDDLCDDLTYDQAVDEHRHLSDAMDANPPAGSGQDQNGKASIRQIKMKKLIAKCLLEAIEIDRPRALRMINSYRSKWLDVMELSDPSQITTLEDYFVFRNLNGGMEPFWSMVQFSMAIDISDEENVQIRPIFQAAEAALVLTNDYWSWDREWHHAHFHSKSARIVNAVELLMRTKALPVDNAKNAVRGLILAYEAEYLRLRDELYAKSSNIPSRLKSYVEVCGVIVAGNHYWCANCPRHHAWRNNQKLSSDSESERASMSPQIFSPVSEHYSHYSDPRSLSSNVSSNAEVGSQHSDESGYDIDVAKSARIDSTALLAPCNYIRKMPSKGVRGMLIEAMNQWFPVKTSIQQEITEIVDILHSSSLILDDIEDCSDSRRGQPATHTIFGSAQSINSANYMFVQAVMLARNLKNPNTLNILLQELHCLFLGQSWDLYWKHCLQIPSEEEFLEMVDNKTGAMFRLLARMMISESSHPSSEKAYKTVVGLAQAFGRFFQVRDDLMNLQSVEYHSQKGFCEDLDEGKISYLIVLLLQRHPEYHDVVTGIFRRQTGSFSGGPSTISLTSKQYILRLLKESGVMAATLDKAKSLEATAYEMIEEMERTCNETNPVLRVVISRLSVHDIHIEID